MHNSRRVGSAKRNLLIRDGLLRGALIAAICALLAPAGRLSAQVLYGSIVGAVQDASGAVVPDATVTIVNTGTGQTLTATTTSSGSYSLTNLLEGSYDLKITAKGFRPYTRKSVPVTVNTVRREDISLELGQVSEGITVEASAQALQTDKADVHTDLSADIVQNLPLPHYRNYQSLINLVPGATPGVLQNSIQVSPERALSTNINGVNRNNNGTRIDGSLEYLSMAAASRSVRAARGNNRNRKHLDQQFRRGARHRGRGRNHRSHQGRHECSARLGLRVQQQRGAAGQELFQ